jgi:hypothetical protein
MGIIHIFLAQITTSIRSAYTHQQQVRHHLFVWQACITTSHRPCIQTIHRPLSLLCKWRATINGEKPSIGGMAPLLLPIKHDVELLSPPPSHTLSSSCCCLASPSEHLYIPLPCSSQHLSLAWTPCLSCKNRGE